MKNLLISLFLALSCLGLTACSATENEDGGGGDDNTTDVEKVMQKLGFGWNLGNHFDSYYDGGKLPAKWDTWWDGATPTKRLYTSLAAAGVKTVRIPVTWGPFEGAAPAYPIKSELMALVKQNVQWAKEAGLNVVLNSHHDEYWQDILGASTDNAKNEEVKTRIAATWRQIAMAFKDEGDYLIFETFNEIQDGGWGWGTSQNDGGKQYRILNEWNQLALTTIRNTGSQNATRWIAVPGYAAAPKFTMENLVLPNDPAKRTIVAVHCYDPYDFTLAAEDTDGANASSGDLKVKQWGHNAGNSWDEKAVEDVLKQLKAKYIDHNIPCYLGEFGCSKHNTTLGENCRAYYLEYFCRAAYFNGLAVMLWDNNNPGAGAEHFAYFNHSNGAYMDGHDNLVKTMVKASTSTDANYTLESIYNRAPSK